MGEIGIKLQSAILYVAGIEGLDKFSRAGYVMKALKVLLPDGSIDLPKLKNMLLDVFPEEQASAIADNVIANHGLELATIVAEDGPSEDNLAKYLATDAGDVRDLINEARRIRLAMGKPVPGMAPQVKLHAEPPEVRPAFVVPEKPSISLVAPFVPEKPAVSGPGTVEAEIRKFVMARTAYTSVDIMDFIRYLKDKGYHFQENIVLENVYTWLEERKSGERAALMADIAGFLELLPWPTEEDVSAFIERKRSEGIMCEAPEIKRMFLVEMIRKH